jgi:predicted dehydrogenase
MTQEQLLNTPGLQAVLVETRVRDLLDVAEACVEAGKHIHVDKPAGESLVQLKRIMASAQRQRLLVQMGYVYRYNPAVVLLRDFLAQGWLGQIFEIHGVISEFNPPETRMRLAEYKGGMMFELGCHLIDIVVGMMGKPESVTPYIQHSAGDGLADNMLAVLTTEKTIATVKSTAMEVEGQGRRHLTVCGTEGTFHIQPMDKPKVQITLAKPRGRYKAGLQEVAMPKHARYIKEAAEMASAIRGEEPPLYSYEHDLAVQETLLKACGLPVDI